MCVSVSACPSLEDIIHTTICMTNGHTSELEICILSCFEINPIAHFVLLEYSSFKLAQLDGLSIKQGSQS